jgi:hypothetical protein
VPSVFIRATASRTRPTTSIVRSNFCIRTMPVTISVVSSRPAMPSRGVKPICILATSETSTGWPPCWVSTIPPMSSSDLTTPRPRTLTACSPIAIVRPPTLALLVAIALMICGIDTPKARMRLRSISA